MAFQLLFSSRRDDQIGHLWREETPKTTHPLYFADLIGNTLLQMLVQRLNLFCPLA